MIMVFIFYIDILKILLSRETLPSQGWPIPRNNKGLNRNMSFISKPTVPELYSRPPPLSGLYTLRAKILLP